LHLIAQPNPFCANDQQLKATAENDAGPSSRARVRRRAIIEWLDDVHAGMRFKRVEKRVTPRRDQALAAELFFGPDEFYFGAAVRKR